MPTRSWDAESSYRFGFNTQERIDEISGKGNHNTALFWEYDTRLGRRWNLDPVVIPFISSYACLNLNPIYHNDINGDRVINKHENTYKNAKNKYETALTKFKEKHGIKEFDKEMLQANKDLLKDYNKSVKKLEKKFNNIENRYLKIEENIQAFKKEFNDEFNELNNIEVNGEKIDVVVGGYFSKFYGEQSPDPINGEPGELGVKVPKAEGFVQFVKDGKSVDGNRYFNVGIYLGVVESRTILKILYHEFRHIHYKLNSHLIDPRNTEEEQVTDDTEKHF